MYQHRNGMYNLRPLLTFETAAGFYSHYISNDGITGNSSLFGRNVKLGAAVLRWMLFIFSSKASKV